MKQAPVVMFVYNRADHFMKTYDALCKCEGVEQTDLFVFSDGARNEKDIEKVNIVRTAVREQMKKTPFQNMKVIESPVNRGLAASVIDGVTKVLEEYGKVIVVEDDCVTSPYFLNFMNSSLAFYEKEKCVGAIAGYTPSLKYPEEYNEDVFVAYRSCSCGWATWKDRWKGIDWELKNMKDFYKNPKLVQKLNSNGNDRFIRLYRQTKGNGSSWSVRFGAHLVKNDQFTVYPRYSYIQNIGCDESGVHSTAEDAVKMRVNLSDAIENPRLIKPEVNDEIQKIMKKHYSGGVVSDIKRTVATSVIVMKERIKG